MILLGQHSLPLVDRNCVFSGLDLVSAQLSSVVSAKIFCLFIFFPPPIFLLFAFELQLGLESCDLYLQLIFVAGELSHSIFEILISELLHKCRRTSFSNSSLMKFLRFSASVLDSCRSMPLHANEITIEKYVPQPF